MAIAGFVISLFALFYAPYAAIVTQAMLGVSVGVVVAFPGLVLAAAGYAKAQREGRPRGLATAGVIIGLAGVILSCTVLLLLWR